MEDSRRCILDIVGKSGGGRYGEENFGKGRVLLNVGSAFDKVLLTLDFERGAIIVQDFDRMGIVQFYYFIARLNFLAMNFLLRAFLLAQNVKVEALHRHLNEGYDSSCSLDQLRTDTTLDRHLHPQ